MNDYHYKFKMELALACPILFHRIYTRWLLFPGDDSYGQEIGTGWYGLVRELCLQAEKIIYTKAERKAVKNYFMEIKQKDGALDITYCGEDEEIRKLVNEACRKSQSICELCGKGAEFRESFPDLRMTLCDDHYSYIRKDRSEVIYEL